MRSFKFAHTSRGDLVPITSMPLPQPLTRQWAFGDSTGRGVRVCVIDSGVDPDHEWVGRRCPAYAVTEEAQDLAAHLVEASSGPLASSAPPAATDSWRVVPDDAGDVAGHGTACASIIRKLAPDCELTSVRVLSNSLKGNGEALVTALKWAIDQKFALVNVSLSTRKDVLKERLHDLADQAFYASVTLVSAAHNSPVISYPWRFPSVISVGSHEIDDPEYLECNPTPPVDFFALGVNVEVGWPGGTTRVVSGNSFATPHVVGLCARILQQHPDFGTPQLKHVLAAISNNQRN